MTIQGVHYCKTYAITGGRSRDGKEIRGICNRCGYVLERHARDGNKRLSVVDLDGTDEDSEELLH